MKIKYLILLLLTAGAAMPLAAQESIRSTGGKTCKKAWEIGLGGTVYQFNRVSFTNFSNLGTDGYTFDLKLKSPVWGGNIYVARELNSHFYLDFQSSIGHGGKSWGSENNNWLFSAGLGIQWRLGEYFNSKHIDPYLRVGVGYMYKGFDIYYAGTEGLTPDEMQWVLNNIANKDGADRNHLVPISVGLGVNMWMNDHWGIGLQGDYVFMPHSSVAHSLQGTARIMYRWGGKSKKATPAEKYIDRPVEVIVEKVVEVERIVEVEKIVEVPGKETMLLGLFNNIHFDFDKATLTSESETVMDEVAEILKRNSDDNYLISGFTDIRGSMEYNQDLSERRAKAVVEALVARGVDKDILKARGASKRIAIAGTSASDEVRRGDRKVTIEVVTNREYWDYLGEKGY